MSSHAMQISYLQPFAESFERKSQLCVWVDCVDNKVNEIMTGTLLTLPRKSCQWPRFPLALGGDRAELVFRE